ncbi:MAG: DUF3881 family protein [Lachnospiraceae bacterium]|nr:DUF3881 family protein [Lachnospiraceae bacterium]
MHSFLKSIGFGSIKNRSDEERLINLVIENSSERQLFRMSEERSIVELYMEVAEDTGVVVRGEQDGRGNFHVSHYCPVRRGSSVTTEEPLFVNKRVDTDAYTGMCDDYRIGVSLIFYIQNVVELLKNPIRKKERRRCPVYLSALATDGKILLPVEKTKKEEEKVKMDLQNRSALIAEAKQGNPEAMQSLTFDDIDQYALVSRRIRREDIYSIVETSFIPYGSESDNYSILGYITAVEKVQNSFTKEEFYILKVVCNEMSFDVCINTEDLLGEPLPGRRFRGNIWMQGRVEV